VKKLKEPNIPYILPEKRKLYDPSIQVILENNLDYNNAVESAVYTLANNIEVGGDLNYIMSKIIWSLFFKNKRYSTAEDLMNSLEETRLRLILPYQTSVKLDNQLANILSTICMRSKCDKIFGTIRCVELEFYRRWVADYEQGAINRNGDLEL